MIPRNELLAFLAEMDTGLPLTKCQQCGCMHETLATLTAALPHIDPAGVTDLTVRRDKWAAQLLPVQYTCLGCDHCYAGAAQNALVAAFPAALTVAPLNCDFHATGQHWPPVVGEYFVVDPAAPVAVSTLASVELAAQLAQQKPAGLALAGKTETENIGLDKVIKNVVSNPALRFLIVAGREAQGHGSGQALLALAAHGVDDGGRIIGATGKRPVLRNVSRAEIDAFRQQVQVIDLIGCEDLTAIAEQIMTLAQASAAPCGCGACADSAVPLTISTVMPLTAAESRETVVMDQAGYFVIVPLADRRVINVEHYAYDDTLLHVIEGPTARALYQSIIAQQWVSELSHAAYLGKELAKAELALQYGLPYVQDGA